MNYWSYLYLAAVESAYIPDFEPQPATLRALLSNTRLTPEAEPFQANAMCVIVTQHFGDSAREALGQLTDNLWHLFRRQNGYAASEFCVPTTFYSVDQDEIPVGIRSEFDHEGRMEFKIDLGAVQFQI